MNMRRMNGLYWGSVEVLDLELSKEREAEQISRETQDKHDSPVINNITININLDQSK